ncbi:MAG: imidazoleglycerol-phosphate dehydratase HisB [Gammaproteobacteria bacterium]|jgi:imidazoleglycerol-phosphate dehydratase|nr:imidazoleglycerol-phosphate dehydratase HisB [Gammaproteobacteria bacterium]MBT5406803.1 imidazoleglycerol-phosphate dehydratase HisB [Gammaproteobacteria bacterium]MBT5643804.1 imidazoleglycerol-phosphate dehydratase HisB [Gammaproteobacteria bacterium]MBT5862811.1 imidazoleglycerol-phosphate dehydratase HisB [Gammaproteobacteria bacterium]MBT7236472.1 imidazoleglycerol-phosphate dehydratase HisB [Gammaproteobacteria bacterium]|tara:strand:+ start:2208 stop:2801 length:594 start_codon:yes stop_codon:yes gene_type:complete
MKKRIALVERVTKETQIKAEINLDGQGDSSIKAGLPFLEHMLEQVARHGMFDLKLLAKGDLEIDAHHTVEDVGIVLGQALEKALGNKIGITRFGSAYVPLDESLSRVVLDFSGRPGLEFNVTFPRSRVGEFDIDLLQEFFQGFVNHAKATIHIDNIRGGNSHHIAETIFKAFGKALKMAVTIDPRQADKIPSTKELI